MRIFLTFILFIASFSHATTHIIDQNNPYMLYLIPKVIGYSHQEDFLKEIEIENYRNHKLAKTVLELREEKWEQEISTVRKPLQSQVAEGAISQYLLKIEEANKGLFTDIVALDKRGLVVGMTAGSHKYNRFYEDKFSKPWNAGPNGVYISPYLFSPTVGKSLIYICITITNRAHESQGVLIAGVDKDIMEVVLKNIVNK